MTANAESVVLSFPAAGSVLGPDPPGTGNPSPALSALLGASRAAALLVITHDPDVTTGQLAATLHLSASVASRHAGVLRAAGLIASVREGMVVRHHPTRLGIELAANSQ